MNIEHIKAHLNKARIWPRQNGKSDQYESLQSLSILVAAVERVQALHSPWPSPSIQTYCRTCAHPMPCPTRQALETPS